MIHQLERITWYDDDLRVPLWVAYELPETTRMLSLREETVSAKTQGYRTVSRPFVKTMKKMSLNRGHIFPSADASRGRLAMTNTFIFSNMAPQHDLFNRGILGQTGRQVRRWAVVADGVYVVTGAVFDRNDDGQRDADADAELMSDRGDTHTLLQDRFARSAEWFH